MTRCSLRGAHGAQVTAFVMVMTKTTATTFRDIPSLSLVQGVHGACMGTWLAASVSIYEVFLGVLSRAMSAIGYRIGHGVAWSLGMTGCRKGRAITNHEVTTCILETALLRMTLG